MAHIPPPVATVRTAVRNALRSFQRDSLVLVACSGGADSMALASAAAFFAPRLGLRAGLVTVDHGLQSGSDSHARAVADWASALFDPVVVSAVNVNGRPGGPEASARDARYEALGEVAAVNDAAAVLLGHTRDDQAETVLLALARGSGPRGMSGMPVRRGLLLRPFLDVSRADTRKACAALGLSVWEDPHNSDPSFARSRVRHDALPALVASLGPSVIDNLARTAAQLALDNAALDDLAAPFVAAELTVSDLSGMPSAVRTRVLHMWARRLGCSGSALSHRHVSALDAFVTAWHGQGAVALPGGIHVVRRDGRLCRIDM